MLGSFRLLFPMFPWVFPELEANYGRETRFLTKCLAFIFHEHRKA